MKYIFRLRVLANEVEILQGIALVKVKILRKAQLNHNQSKAELEAVRNDKSKMSDQQSALDNVVTSRKLEIDRLNMMVRICIIRYKVVLLKCTQKYVNITSKRPKFYGDFKIFIINW